MLDPEILHTADIGQGLLAHVTNRFRDPPKNFKGKHLNVQNLARFLTTFDFDREYLRNGSTYRKSEKYLINDVSSPIG